MAVRLTAQPRTRRMPCASTRASSSRASRGAGTAAASRVCRVAVPAIRPDPTGSGESVAGTSDSTAGRRLAAIRLRGQDPGEIADGLQAVELLRLQPHSIMLLDGEDDLDQLERVPARHIPSGHLGPQDEVVATEKTVKNLRKRRINLGNRHSRIRLPASRAHRQFLRQTGGIDKETPAADDG